MALLGHALANDVGGSVHGHLTLLASVARHPVMVAVAQGEAAAAANTWLATLAKGLVGVDYANVFNAQGLCLASSNAGAAGKIQVADRDYFKAVIGQGKADVVSKALISRTTGKAAVVLAQPVRDDSGRLVGLINMGMDLESLTKDLSGTRIGQTGYAYILDADGMVLAHPKVDQIMKDSLGATDIGKRIMAVPEQGVIAYTAADGDHLAAVQRDPGTGWRFVVEAPLEEFNRYATAATRQNALIALGVTVAILGAVAWLLRACVLRGLGACVAFCRRRGPGRTGP